MQSIQLDVSTRQAQRSTPRGRQQPTTRNRKRLWYSVSGAILVISVVSLIVFGLNFSVDFKGGSVYQFPTGSASITQVRQAVSSGPASASAGVPPDAG